ncbi:hypothetical protein CR513_20272, partial [Mucuna pruriens]
MKVPHRQWPKWRSSLHRLQFHLDRIQTDFDPISILLITSQSRKTMINPNLRGQRSFGIILGMGLVQVAYWLWMLRKLESRENLSLKEASRPKRRILAQKENLGPEEAISARPAILAQVALLARTDISGKNHSNIQGTTRDHRKSKLGNIPRLSQSDSIASVQVYA